MLDKAGHAGFFQLGRAGIGSWPEAQLNASQLAKKE